MKHLIVTSLLLITSIASFGQMIMSAEGIKPDNACNPDQVYFLMQRKARPVKAIEEIEQKLNEAISFAKDNPQFRGESAIQFVVNCKGEVGGGFHAVKKSGNAELDNQLIAFFKTIKT